MASVITHPLQECEYENVCSITLISYKTLAEQGNLVLTSCGHKFSRHHINEWVAKAHTCPVCVGSIDNNFIPVGLAVDNLSKNRLKSNSVSSANKPAATFKPREATKVQNTKAGFLSKVFNKGRRDLDGMIRHAD